MRLILIAVLFIFNSIQAWAAEGDVKYVVRSQDELEIMAPLTIGDIHNPSGAESAPAWEIFRLQVREAKEMGYTALHTDIWWGLVEPEDGKFNFTYYRKMAQILREEKMGWKPIQSTHQLGGNVGDVGSQGIPTWLWSKYIGLPGVTDENSLKYKSEQGNYNSETVSPWGTKYIIKDLEKLFVAFQTEFSDMADILQGMALSFGPAGELRHPSYNAHDKDTGYGTRGALQCYSDLAVASFREFVMNKYGHDFKKINAAWGSDISKVEEIYVPDPKHLDDFFKDNVHHSRYGKDFFKWYNQSLVEHGEMIGMTAIRVFNSATAAFKGKRLAGKIPSLHWLAAINRLPELAAGLIHTDFDNWHSDESAHGYKDILDMFKRLDQAPDSPGFEAHDTGIEMDDGRDGPVMGSLAKSLVGWISEYSRKIGLRIKGENALAYEINNAHAWDNIYTALTEQVYAGVTILRLNSFLENDEAKLGFKNLLERLRQFECDQKLKEGI